MGRAWKYTILGTAVGLILLVLSMMRWPSDPPGTLPGTLPAGPPRSANRARQTTSPHPPRRAKDLATLVRLSADGGFPKLSGPEIENYLQSQNRNAGSLLAAFRLSGDGAYLKEALERFPHDPQVLFASVRLEGDPAKRLKILESFKQADPGNSLGNLLAAKTLFDLGKNDEAIAEVMHSGGKPIRNFTMISCQNSEEAFISAGYSPVEAKFTSLFSHTVPELLSIRRLCDSLKEMRTAREAAGDAEGAESLREIQTGIAWELQSGVGLVSHLIGFNAEKQVLQEIDTAEARARIEELDRQKTSLQESSKKTEALFKNPAVPESDWLLYLDRLKLFGEKAANDWIQEKYPER